MEGEEEPYIRRYCTQQEDHLDEPVSAVDATTNVEPEFDVIAGLELEDSIVALDDINVTFDVINQEVDDLDVDISVFHSSPQRPPSPPSPRRTRLQSLRDLPPSARTRSQN